VLTKVVVCTIVAGIVGLPARGDVVPQVRGLLATVGGFTAAQIAAVERGEAVAKVLPTERREIAVFGAVRIQGRRDRLIDRYRDVTNLRKSNIVLQVGTFSRPPRTDDLQALTFEDYDLDAPRNCVPGDCPVRLSSDMMARMRAAVKWGAPDARQQSAGAWRGVLTDIVRGYSSAGDVSLPEYANKEEPLSVRTELDRIYAQFAFLADVSPEFLRYIREYPHGRLDGAEDTLYWSKNDLGIRPVMGITHQTTYAPSGKPALIAVKRIYAAHYVDGGLSVTVLSDDRSGGFYMMTIERIRTRSLTSFTRTFVRSAVQDKSRNGIEKMLRSSKRSLEGHSVPH
jgi:hypothetical protein